MPGGAEELDLKFNTTYPGLYTAFVLTETMDGLGDPIRIGTDSARMDVDLRLYYQMQAVQGGRAYIDSNKEMDIVAFLIDFWQPLLALSVPEEIKWRGGLFRASGVLDTKIEPLLDPYWWLDPTAGQVNDTNLFHGFTEEPAYTIESELLGRVMHCQIGGSILTRGTV